MGTQISVPLGSYVIALNNTGGLRNYGDRVTGDKLRLSYIPGSSPYFDKFTPTDTFECHGYCPNRCNALWQRVT